MNLLDIAQAEIVRLESEVDDLKAQIAQMRRDYGYEEGERIAGLLAKSFYLSPQEAWLLGVLRAAKEMRSKNWLLDNMPGLDVLADARNDNLVPVIICRLRKRMGAEAIQTFWGRGYGLTPTGHRLVDEALQMMQTFASPNYRAWLPNGSRNRDALVALERGAAA